MDLASRYLSQKLIISGNRVELIKYQRPLAVDKSGRVRKEIREAQERRFDSIYRSRRNLRQIIWANLTPYTKMLSLTCAQTCLDKDDFERKLQTFVQAMKRKGFTLRYVYVLEHQKERGLKEGNEGSWHAHYIIFNNEKIPLDVLNSCWKYGTTDIRILNGLRSHGDNEKINSVAAYCSKYITKENIQEFGSHVYRCSLGLARPVEIPLYFHRIYNDNGTYFDTEVDNPYFRNLVKYFSPEYSSTREFSYSINNDTVTNSIEYMQGCFNNE